MGFGLSPLKDICEDPVNLAFTILDGTQSAHLLLQLLHLSTSERTHLPQVRPPSCPAPGRGTRHSLQLKTWKATSSLVLLRLKTHMCQGQLLQQPSPCGTSPLSLYNVSSSPTPPTAELRSPFAPLHVSVSSVLGAATKSLDENRVFQLYHSSSKICENIQNS